MRWFVVSMLIATALVLGPMPAQGQTALPVSPVGAGSGFFDPTYAPELKRQHLGTDLQVPAGTDVSSPVDGKVVLNATSGVIVDKAYLVISDSVSGFEHVLGHIISELKKGDVVTRGAKVGKVLPWPKKHNPGESNSHVHWGVNWMGLSAARGMAPEGEWGWGQAPLKATVGQSACRGWVDPASLGPTLGAANGAATRFQGGRLVSEHWCPMELFSEFLRPGQSAGFWSFTADHRLLRNGVHMATAGKFDVCNIYSFGPIVAVSCYDMDGASTTARHLTSCCAMAC
jgi:murein DD-endopeptidase MepM/ murein hydrolase activator NlpD